MKSAAAIINDPASHGALCLPMMLWAGTVVMNATGNTNVKKTRYATG